MREEFRILDCTIRDGGYINNWNFSIKDVKNMCKALDLAGVDIFEIGFLNNKDGLPIWRNCDKQSVKSIREVRHNIKISAMLEVGTVGMQLALPNETGIDILRIALNKDKVSCCFDQIKRYKDLGYEVFIQLMGITSYTYEDLIDVIKKLDDLSVDCINIGDSYGALIPEKTHEIISLMKRTVKAKVGLHAHNNMQLGMANALAAIEAGANIIDGSLYGMGRGGGNIPTELLVSYFQKIYNERFNVLPLLEFIDRTMLTWYQQPNWGYSLPSLISGVYECHPYYTSKLIEKREFTIDQILKTAKIVSERNVTGFSENLLEGIIEKILIQKTESGHMTLAQFISENTGKVKYLNRHDGKDFLILGNGPSIKEYYNEIEIFIKQKNPIILGANNLGKNFIPHYHAFNNQRRFEAYRDNVDKRSILLLGPSIQLDQITWDYERIFCYNSFLNDVDIIEGIVTSNCRSISALLIAVAISMGANKIYLAGMDGYSEELIKNGHTMFYEEDESTKLEDTQEKHKSNGRFLNQLDNLLYNKNGNRLSFITPTTYKIPSMHKV
ncbi:hypothetical protein Ami103574_02075 [Aminipila butyrica]|uniref:Pyruvate carboxyltransferase domain-containing protein n=1 Tax=Aminipila butyrica TaxID=433296 RepID=A0A858BTA3_9FIRM|nr:hypothetical protein [Aminipila butyrica]QIB68170.1 hypothetical protein Ami103574_02075 [Aminipila butyrica]